MRSVILSLALLGTSSGSVTTTWDAFLVKYGKKYSQVEVARRESIFNANLDIIAQHNKESTSFTMEVGLSSQVILAPTALN
jgi:hypothetical protein